MQMALWMVYSGTMEADHMGLIELWGTRTDHHQRTIGGPFEPDTTRELLATFTRLEDAKKYVRDSELAVHPNRYVYVDIQRGKYRYRKGSLLREFDDCELCEHHERPKVAHNPILEAK